MTVHDHITDWQHLPSSFLAGKRAIATTVEGTTIDGFLQSMTTKFSNGSGSMVQLFFGGVFQPVIISLNGGENQLCRAYDSIQVLQEEEMSRAETTAMLSKLVEKRLRNQTAFWASEVNFDRNTPDERRVDYVGFKPWNINGEPVPASVEKGCFEFYEVKSCMADFTSGNGLTFYGDQNYLVCTKELCDEIVWQKMVPPRVNAILTPDSTGSKLILDYVQSYNDLSYRRRPASEILWAMVKANGKRTN